MSKIKKGFRPVYRREWKRIFSRPVYLLCMVGVPLFCYLFFTSLLWEGVPERLPIAIVDHDQSSVSRNLIRTLNSMSGVDITIKAESFTSAREAMQRNEIYAFMIIPEGFEAKVTAGRQPELAIFSNDAYFVAGMFSYKTLRTAAALSNGAVVKTAMLAKGASEAQIMSQLQPVLLDTYPLGNPWISYSVYLSPVILPTMLELLIFLITVFSIGIEIKEKTSRRLLVLSNHSVLRLLLAKLAPQTILFTLLGILLNVYLFGYLRFPAQNGMGSILAATFLLVLSSQAMGVFMIGTLPTLRLGLSFASLVGVVAFSLVGFSMPVSSMYAPFQYLSPLYPMRHFFLIYSDQALNGLPLWFSLRHYLAMTLFLFLPFIVMPRLKKALYKQEYKP